MKLNKFIATLAIATTITTSTLSLSGGSALAVKVRVVRNCMTYNDQGQQVGTLNPGYYTAVRYVKFANSRLNGTRVYADFTKMGKNIGYVNIANRCLQGAGGKVIEYNI